MILFSLKYNFCVFFFKAQFNQGNTQQFQQPGGHHQAAHGGFGHESAHDAR